MSRLDICDTKYDLAIIGGGIYGAALYWEACHRGLKTILLEQNDFGAGTSSNSLRTIHGGLRYLQNMDIARCLMSAQERQVLMGIAPNLIEPLPCVMPTQKKFSRSRTFLKAGTLAYDVLTLPIRWKTRAGHKIPHTRLLSKKELLSTFPAIEFGDITGGALWYDAQVVNSERLTLNYLLSGDETGAGVSLNYVRAEHLNENHGRVSGLQLSDTLNDEKLAISSDQVVDCSGSLNFTGQVSELPDRYGYVKGFNLVFPGDLCKAAVGMEVPGEDGRKRLLFISPWQSKTLVGTWYLPARDGADALISDSEIETAIGELNGINKNGGFSTDNLLDVQAGQLPADREQNSVNDLADALQAHTCIVDVSKHEGPLGYFRLQGTKYTTAREGAKRMVDTLAKTAIVSVAPSRSHKDQLFGCRIHDIHETSEEMENEFGAIFGAELTRFCLANYGEQAMCLMLQAKQAPEEKSQVETLVDLMVCRSFDSEKAITARDVIKRRLGGLPSNLIQANAMQIQRSLNKYTDENVKALLG